MEQRHTEIREGAGLEESRINREFVDFLQRWGGWILIGFAGIALAYAGLQKLEQMRRDSRDNAFLALNEALESANPEGLTRVADEHDVGVVPHMARLEAADIWLECARKGLTPGDLYEVTSTGQWQGEIPESSLDFDPDAALTRAAELYEQVVEAARGDKRHAEFALGGLFGLAAVAETRADKEQAAGYYRDAKELATEAGFADLAAEAQARLDSLESVQVATLPPADALYQPETEAPVIEAPPITPILTPATPADPAATPVDPADEPAPAEGDVPADVEPAPAEGETPPAEEDAPPAEGEEPAAPAPTP